MPINKYRIAVEEEMSKKLAVRKPAKGTINSKASIIFGPEIKKTIENEFTMGKIFRGFIYFASGEKQEVIIKEVDWNKDHFYTSNPLMRDENGIVKTMIYWMKKMFFRCWHFSYSRINCK